MQKKYIQALKTAVNNGTKLGKEGQAAGYSINLIVIKKVNNEKHK